MDKCKTILKYIMITLIALTLYYLVGCYGRITTGVELAYIYLQYPLLCIASILYGPVVGLITGFVGHCLIDLHNSHYIWFSWAIGSGLTGFLIGFIFKHHIFSGDAHPGHEATIKERVRYGIIIFLVNIISFLIVAPTIQTLISDDPIRATFTQGIFVAVADGLTTVIVTDLFFSAFRHTILRRVVSVLTLLNSLVLVSYGNMNIGSIILYVLTIFFALYLFFYKKWHEHSDNKILTAVKVLVFTGFAVFFCMILFIATTAYINRPTGNENIAIVLGAGLDGEEPSKILQMRLDTAINWYKQNTSRVIVTSGGKGNDEIISEGEAMRNYLIKNGVPAENIIAECRSTTTEENFKYSYEIINSFGYKYNTGIICITNNFHCFRAVNYAKRQGITDIHSLAAPTPTFGIIPNYCRECLALIKFIIKGV